MTTLFLLALASLGAVGWIVALLCEKKLKIFVGESKIERVLFAVVFIAMWIFGSTKPSVKRGIAKEDKKVENIVKGIVLTKVATNECFDFSAPQDAVVCDD